MDINQSSSNDSSSSSNVTMPSTSKKSSTESNERKSSSSCNGDSGYHSDMSGYHKGVVDPAEADAELSADSTSKSSELPNEPSERVDGIENPPPSSSQSVSRLSCNGSAHLEIQDAESLHEIDSQISETVDSETLNCKSVTHCDSYLITTSIQNNGAIKSCSTCVGSHSSPALFTTCDTHPDTAAATNCMQHNCTLQESPHICTTAASSQCLPPKPIETSHSNDDFKTLLQDLALKIEFCIVFGYTASQIKTAITKLSIKASKNDILAELSSVQSASAMPSTTLGMITSLENTRFDVGEKDGELICKGADISRGPDLQPRGPLSVDNESKDGNNGMCMIDESENLRPVVIDGSNVAMSHGNKQYFSCKGILLAVDYFRNRNHRDITVFVPNYRKESPRSDAPIKDRQILDKLEEERILVYTPSRHIKGKRVTCYDDRFILRLAEDTEGIIVSNDHFRDLQNEKAEWKELVEKRLLMYSFASDRFMPPDDPLGRNGPNINNFLQKRPMTEEQSKQPCPYGKKCTYGKKCKFFHPECARPVSERMKENSERRLRASNESIELAVELMKANNVHNSTLSGTGHDKMYNPAPLSPCGPSHQVHDSKSLFNGRKVDNARQRRVPNNVHDESQMYSHSHSNGRLGHVSSPGDNAYSQQYQKNCARLPDDFRHMSLSNQFAMKQNSHLSHVHSNGQVCYDSHCQNYPLVNDAARVHYPPNTYAPPENGPLDFHIENQAKFKNSAMNQQYQHISPAGLQMYDRNNGANPMMQRQHMNPTTPYPSVPGFQSSYPAPSHPVYSSGYAEPPYQANQRILCYNNATGHSQGSTGIHPGMLPTSSYYVTPINSSTGSNSSSMSHSYPFVALEKSVAAPSLSHRNLTNNSSTGSEPKTYPPRAPRGYSSPNPQQHMRQVPYNSNSSFISDGQPMNHASHLPPSAEPPLSNVNNPRHFLYRNLCSLFQRHIVEAVMSAHPEVSEPKLLVKMCLDND